MEKFSIDVIWKIVINDVKIEPLENFVIINLIIIMLNNVKKYILEGHDRLYDRNLYAYNCICKIVNKNKKVILLEN